MDDPIGTLQIAPDRQVRFSRITKRGQPMLDVRELDFFAGCWVPNKRAVVIPLAHAQAFADMAVKAAGGGA